MELVYYFSMASKYDFLSQNIKSGNLNYSSGSRIKHDLSSMKMDTGSTKNDGLEAEAFTTSQNVFTAHGDNKVQCPRDYSTKHDLTQGDLQRFKMCYFAKSM